MMKFEAVRNLDEFYDDFEFGDENPRTLYIVTHDKEAGRWYGTIQTSATDDGPFDGDESMPAAMVEELRQLVPAQYRGEQ